MILTIQDKRIIVLNEEWFQLATLSQGRNTIPPIKFYVPLRIQH